MRRLYYNDGLDCIDSYKSEPPERQTVAEMVEYADNKNYLNMIDIGNYTQDTSDLWDDMKQDRICIASAGIVD